MNHAIELYFDDQSTTKIEEIRHILEVENVPVDSGTMPHISLALYENTDERSLADKIVAFAKQKVDLRLTFGSLGIFPTDEGVIFLAPKVTHELLTFHQDFLQFMSEIQNHLNPYYDFPLWMPHCTLGIHLNEEDLSRSVKLLKRNNPLPITAKVKKIGILSFPPNKEVFVANFFNH